MQYRPEIDGLRAVAVLPVVFFHAGFQQFSGGFVGVDVFFVISGYLITSILLSEAISNQFSIIRFYERRARRILPALFFVMLACLPFAWSWLLPEDFKKFSHSLIAVSASVSNILFFHESGYFDTATELKPLLHTWSLAVEEQFYVLFPLMLTFTLRRFKIGVFTIVVLVVMAASLAYAEWAAYAKPSFAYFMLPTRAWELMVGALAAIYFVEYADRYPIRNQALAQTGSVLGLLLITCTVFMFDQHTPFPGLYATVPTLGAALIVLFASTNTYVGRLLAQPLLVGIGLISYSAYLWHQPLFAFARHRTLEEPSRLLYFGLAVLSFILAYLTWKFVEAPFRDRKKFSRSQIFGYSACVSVLFVAIGLAGHFTQGFAKRVSPQLVAISSPPAFFTGQNQSCHREGNHYEKLENSCVLGDAKHVNGVLIGDSHANAISTQLGVDLQGKPIGLLQMTFNGCPSIQGVYRSDMDADSKCSEFNAEALNYLKTHPELEYVVMVSRWTRYLKHHGFDNGEGGVERGDDTLDVIENGVRQHTPETQRVAKIQQKYVDEIQTLLVAGKKVILVYPIPEVGWRAPDFLVKQMMFGDGKVVNSTNYETFKQRNLITNQTLDGVGKHANLYRVYPEKMFCDQQVKGRCVFEANGESLYFDSNHVSNAGARMINQGILGALESAAATP